MIAARKLAAAVRNLPIRTVSAQWMALGLSAVLVLVLFSVRLDGRPHADWLQFIGRFHPMLVHLPIGMLALLPLLELAGTTRAGLREAAGFVLNLTLATGLVTLILGVLLAYGSGLMGVTVTGHMRGGIALVIELGLCVAARPAWTAGQIHRIYPALLAATLVTLVWTAHQGGSLTHGSDYLTSYIPGPFKRIFSPGSRASDAAYVGSIYMRQIHPILDAKCVACHGSSRERASLRLDFYELLLKGGKDGAVIVPRNPGGSLLIQRVTLSPGDRHFMPADGRAPLTPEEIAALRAWILAGASPTAARVPGMAAAAENTELPLHPVPDYSNRMDEILQIERSAGAKLVRVSAKPSDGLILRTVDVASSFDDHELRRFERFAPFIVEAELGRTAVTDACFDTLAKFPHLRALHLEGTAITGRDLGKLSSLSELAYLNLSGTRVTSAVLAPLRSMPNLRHLYLFDTAAEPRSPAAETSLRSTQ